MGHPQEGVQVREQVCQASGEGRRVSPPHPVAAGQSDSRAGQLDLDTFQTQNGMLAGIVFAVIVIFRRTLQIPRISRNPGELTTRESMSQPTRCINTISDFVLLFHYLYRHVALFYSSYKNEIIYEQK